MGRWLWAAALLLLAIAPARAADTLVTLPTRPGVSESFWLTEPAGPPRASVILFAGGDNRIGRDPKAPPTTTNFLIRSRQLFADAGLLVASVDTPSDHRFDMEKFRATADYANDIAAVIANLRARAAVPVWLIGTSTGTISAANIAARLKTGGPDGLVLTSSILVRAQNESVASSVDVAAITVPVLFVQHRDDQCPVCRFRFLPGLREKFIHAARTELIAFDGGRPAIDGPCGPFANHGYYGIEDKVVAAIAGWIVAARN